MDYEKEYKEAQDRFKAFADKYFTRGRMGFGDVLFDKTGNAMEEFISIFPKLKDELSESEDERTRKEIIALVRAHVTPNGTCLVRGGSITREKAEAWLEKQKEPRYTKRNALFDECVKNCDPEIMKKVSDEIDAMLEKEQKENAKSLRP